MISGALLQFMIAAHAQDDFPDRDDKTVELGDRPVHTYTLSNEVSYIKPKARVY